MMTVIKKFEKERFHKKEYLPTYYFFCQVPLDGIDVNAFIKFLTYTGMFCAGDPNFQFCIKIKSSCRLYGEPRDILIGEGKIDDFFPGEALNLHNDQSFTGEHKDVPKKGKSQFNVF